MESDGLYRFLVLRSVELSAETRPSDPFVNAYGDSTEGQTVLLKDVTASLASNQVETARQSCENFLNGLHMTSSDPWQLASPGFQDSCAQLAAAARQNSHANAVLPQSGFWDKLADLLLCCARFVAGARQDSPKAAGKVICSTLDDRQKENAIAILPQPELRGKLADLLLCQAFLPDCEILIDTVAQIILCLETIERLKATGNDKEANAKCLAWQIPLTIGKVYLPIELTHDLTAANRKAGGVGAQHEQSKIMQPQKWIGDLILMRQQVRGYSLGEIAHIENVLLRESFERKFRTTRKTEQTLTTETETTHESERDLQSTTRDELRTEIQRALSEDLSLAVNFNVQASYNGGAYSVVAGVGGSASYRRASEERETTSSNHAREVVDKAVDRISERVHTVQESVTSYEEKDSSKHGIDNKDGSDHIVGVYRWLEKQVDLHLISYGRRLIYELMVPEPATFWKRLVIERGNGSVGPPPDFPQMGPAVADAKPTDLSPTDFALRSGDQALSVPARWNELLKLAGLWGVQLEDPPAMRLQANLAFTLAGDGKADPEANLHWFNKADGSLDYYQSPLVVSGIQTEKLTISDGYVATGGDLSLKGWMYVRKGTKSYQYENGSAVLFVGGEKFGITEGSHDPHPIETGTTGNHWDLSAQVLLKNPLSGQQTVAITTNLNGVSGSILLTCERTAGFEHSWERKMFGLFANAYQNRVDAYNDAKVKATLDNSNWSGNLPAETCREIEKCELKRGILSQLTLNTLNELGENALAEPADTSLVPAEPEIKMDAIDTYTRDVSFFEEVFDWPNLSYIFSPYMFGRRKEWANLAVSGDADAQFKSFLSAGAARVQIPVRKGHEPHAEYFFNGLGRYPLDRRIPWLGSMHSIAEDLAAEARDGFEVGLGTVSIQKGSEIVQGTGTNFKDPDDIGRELRIAGKLYIIAAVNTAGEVRIVHPFAGHSGENLSYETGGIVVGPPISVTLPTTLVAIDKRDLGLPSFPSRYV